jgi:hypothetical protein
MIDITKALTNFNTLSDTEIDDINSKQQTEHLRQLEEFKINYKNDICYLCNKPFKTLSKNEPCLHWLLRRCKFKTKDFKLIYEKYGYTNIASFLRWCANIEKPLININDMEEEKPKGKVISNTIKWKNIEWTFDCSENDFKGHAGTAIDYPHYHFQMRIDQQQFINFNSYHLPFKEEEIFAITMARAAPEKFGYDFGNFGMGMNAAMEMISQDPEMAIDNMIKANNEDDSIYHLSTIAIAGEGETISGDLIADLIEESKDSGVPLAKLFQERLSHNTNVRTMISASDNVPEIAKRTEHSKKS